MFAGYEGTSSKLVQALREAIEVDLSEAPEREVCMSLATFLLTVSSATPYERSYNLYVTILVYISPLHS